MSKLSVEEQAEADMQLVVQGFPVHYGPFRKDLPDFEARQWRHLWLGFLLRQAKGTTHGGPTIVHTHTAEVFILPAAPGRAGHCVAVSRCRAASASILVDGSVRQGEIQEFRDRWAALAYAVDYTRAEEDEG